MARFPPATVLTLATPHALSPAATQPAMARAYSRLNIAWESAAEHGGAVLVDRFKSRVDGAPDFST